MTNLLETAATYKALSVMLAYPTESSVAMLNALFAKPRTLEDWRQEYHAIFGGPLPGVLPPLEAEYDQPHAFSKAQSLADLAGFYRAFGLQPSGGIHRADHISVQLEFAHVLVAKEEWARSRGELGRTEVCREARRQLLVEHLGAWGIPYLRLVPRHGGPYARVADAARTFLLEECRQLGVHVPERKSKMNEAKPPGGEETCPVPQPAGNG